MAFGTETLSPVPGAVEVTRHLHLLHPAVCECFGGGLPADWAPQASLPGAFWWVLLAGGLQVGRQGWPWFLSALSSFPLWVVSQVGSTTVVLPPCSQLLGMKPLLSASRLVTWSPAIVTQPRGKVWALCFSSSLGHLTFSFLLSQCLCMPFTMLNLLCVEDLV